MDATSLEWWEVAVRIGGAGLLGGLIGIEREIDGQDAGFRTHLLLAVGAALFGAVSVGAFEAFVTERAASNVQIDVTRIASYVAAGVGFIGGGAIVKAGGSVKGITTAASLWTTAAVGLAAGVGFWSGAVAATVVALVALAVLKPVSGWFRNRYLRNDTIVIELTKDADLPSIVAEIEAASPELLRQILIGRGDGVGAFEIEVEFWSRLDTNVAADLIDRLSARDEVVSLRVGS